MKQTSYIPHALQAGKFKTTYDQMHTHAIDQYSKDATLRAHYTQMQRDIQTKRVTTPIGSFESTNSKDDSIKYDVASREAQFHQARMLVHADTAHLAASRAANSDPAGAPQPETPLSEAPNLMAEDYGMGYADAINWHSRMYGDALGAAYMCHGASESMEAPDVDDLPKLATHNQAQNVLKLQADNLKNIAKLHMEAMQDYSQIADRP